MNRDPAWDIAVRMTARAPVSRCMDIVRDLAELDRYQGSAGLILASEVLVDAAGALGIPEPTISLAESNAEAQWYTYRAPQAWTPIVATVSLPDGKLALDHKIAPFLLATYSQPARGSFRLCQVTEPLKVPTPSLEGCVILLDPAAIGGGDCLELLAESGAAGVLMRSNRSVEGVPLRTRIELPLLSDLFAFSLLPDEFEMCKRAFDDATGFAYLEVDIQVDTSAKTPLMEVVLPGRRPELSEVWVTSHLCHPRPSANDNGSGVAAAFLLASSLMPGGAAGLAQLDRTVRLIIGPEFLGTAWAIRDRLRSGSLRPKCVLNLDMVGEDQELCRSPFVVERASTNVTGSIDWALEHGARIAFEVSSDEYGTWISSPFDGFSDHALFADPSIGVPSAAICHPDDVFNHSDGDTFDKVSPIEILRSSIAGVIAVSLESGFRGSDLSSRNAWRLWKLNRMREADLAAKQYSFVDGGVWSSRLLEWAKFNFSTDSPEMFVSGIPEATSVDRHGPVYCRVWQGPVNVREVIAELPLHVRMRHSRLVDNDKMILSFLFNTFIRVDGKLPLSVIFELVSWNSLRPLPQLSRTHIHEVLSLSSWVVSI